jgi:hypothetical protein
LMAALGAGIFISRHGEYCKEVRELHLIGKQNEGKS